MYTGECDGSSHQWHHDSFNSPDGKCDVRFIICCHRLVRVAASACPDPPVRCLPLRLQCRFLGRRKLQAKRRLPLWRHRAFACEHIRWYAHRRCSAATVAVEACNGADTVGPARVRKRDVVDASVKQHYVARRHSTPHTIRHLPRGKVDRRVRRPQRLASLVEPTRKLLPAPRVPEGC